MTEGDMDEHHHLESQLLIFVDAGHPALVQFRLDGCAPYHAWVHLGSPDDLEAVAVGEVCRRFPHAAIERLRRGPGTDAERPEDLRHRTAGAALDTLSRSPRW